ncbi:unnamed protein product [Linum tenue]|uniref:CCHC-type domain-containing protein n=1 Tax=Linum tenue TaxID=586396 RepID=A0AAV0NW45_9ROSI|nr:unnamed protein product [Linum tenue]
MIVWVQFPALKIHFYHKEVITMLGNLIGRTIKLDYHMLTQQRAKFARVAVEVDISKALVPRIWLDDEWQTVEYENLPEVCFDCGRIGHNKGTCPQNKTQEISSQGNVAGGSPPGSQTQTAEDSNPGFGPWMLVSRKSRQKSGDGHRKGKEEHDTGNQIIIAKNRNHEAVGKDAVQPPSPSTTPNGPLPQRDSTQERKLVIGNESGVEVQKGKGKAIKESTGKGKGLLGPRPKTGDTVTGPKPTSKNGASSSSIRPDPVSCQQLGPKKSDLAVGPAPLSMVNDMPEPPSFKTVMGPNGTLMQIIESPQSSRDIGDTTPSLTARTKRSKGKKVQGKKSPSKLNPMKPLQIWSPIKDRKPKSKSRMASLTLQEISAWTEAAKRPANDGGEKEKTGSEGHL